MKDEELRSQVDYVAGQREAANRVLIEVMNVLREYRDNILVVGGWVPDLYYPGAGHIGSIDVDILLNHLAFEDSSYSTIERLLLQVGYVAHEEKYFSFTKRVFVEGTGYDVDLDVLAGKYGGTADRKRSQHVQGIRALKADGGNFAFEVPCFETHIEARRPDGAIDGVTIKVVSIIPFLAMKAAALGRGKPKDAYDIYFCIDHCNQGLESLVQDFQPFKTHGLILKMLEKFREKFSTPEHAGTKDVVDFLEIDDTDERERITRDVSEKIMFLVRSLQ